MKDQGPQNKTSEAGRDVLSSIASSATIPAATLVPEISELEKIRPKNSNKKL